MSALLIFGAGALAFEWFSCFDKQVNFCGFVSETGAIGAAVGYLLKDRYGVDSVNRVFVSVDSALETNTEIDQIAIAVSRPDVKMRAVRAAKEHRLKLLSFKHSTCHFDDTATVAKGGYFDMYGSVSHNTIVGTCVLSGRGAHLGHDNMIHDFCSLGPGVVLTRDIELGASCEIGANSVILPNVTIAEGVKIGPCSVVARSITEKNTIWSGNPARRYK